MRKTGLPVSVGAQLYIFTKAFDLEDRVALEPVLGGLSEAGYAEIEGFLGGRNDYRELLDAANLRYAGAHCVLAELAERDDLQSAAEYVKRMGGDYLCVSGLIRWHERTASDYEAAIAWLNGAGRVLQALGVALYYHNHDFEFDNLDDANGDHSGMDLLLAKLDFSAVKLCFDTGWAWWAWRAGRNPAAFLHAQKDKIGVVHLRDFLGVESTELGAGKMDIPAILDALPRFPYLRPCHCGARPNRA